MCLTPISARLLRETTAFVQAIALSVIAARMGMPSAAKTVPARA